MKLIKSKCLINGKWVAAESGETFSVFNPATNQKLGSVPNCGQKETVAAIDVAFAAFPAWSGLLAAERSEFLNRWADLIDLHKEELAKIMTMEQGKPITESRGEIDYANSFLRWFAEEAKRVYGDVIPATKSGQHLVVIKQPIGVVGAITPWNFPAAMITRKIAPALAVGCTVVIKPAADTPLTALALAELAQQAKIPPGVINFITGDAKEIGKELTTNPKVRKISFTGSTEIGRLLMQQSASHIKKISLELGGNAPFIVFDDADLEEAVKGAMASKFRNTGQTCVCANRILVQDKVYDAFAKKLLVEIKKLKLGNGLKKGVQQGPLINQDAIDKVQRHMWDAVAKGAKLLTGGKKSRKGDLFFEPTLLINAKTTMLCAKEETFGPIAPLFRFHTEEEAIAIANDTEFGLASYFYSKDIHRIWRVSEALEYGMIGVNVGVMSTAVAPFGGMKESGIGREGSKYGIDDYLEIKYLCMG